jgi:cytochrome bd-type quinol oxidase subunit 2
MLTTFWLVLFGFFLAGYLVLEGADFGAGMLLPMLGRRAEDSRGAVVRAIAPLFLGNEVWLVAAVGISEGAFPRLDGSLFTRLYPVFVPLLAAWLIRDIGLWFRGQGEQVWRWCCDCVIAVASAALAFGWGVVLADVALPTQVFGPASLLSGLLLCTFCLLHGTLFLARRVPTSVSGSIRRIGSRLSLPAAALTALVVAVSPNWPLWILASTLFAAALLARVTSSVPALVATSVGLAAAIPLAAPSLPAAPATTLGVLTPLVIAVAPLMIAAQATLWWLHRNPTRSYFG